jgi:hypothetical protein
VALLDDSYFPAAEFRTPSSLASLRSLGLNSVLTRSGALEAAAFITKLNARARKGNNAALAARAITLAERLLMYLDLHSARLMADDGFFGSLPAGMNRA